MRRPSIRRRLVPGLWAVLVAVAIGVLAGAPAAGASPVEAIAGWEGDAFSQGYAFSTVGVLLDDGKPVSFPVQVSASYLYYDFEGEGGPIRVRAPGGSGKIGIRANGSHAAVGVTGGCELRWERRAHAAGGGFGGAVARGGAVFEGTADLRFGRRFRPFLLATYSGSAHYLFGRAAFRFQCSNLDWSGPVTWSAGLEATGQGNADTDALQAGALLESALTRARLSIGLHGGYKWSDTGTGSRRVCGYGGLSLYRRF